MYAREPLAAAQTALDAALERRRTVETVATSGTYAQRAAARIELEDLKLEIAQLEAEQLAAEGAAAKQAQIARLGELAAAGRQALTDMEAAQLAFDAAVAPILEAYSAACARQQASRSAFYAVLGSLSPAEVERTGADLSGVLINLTALRDKPHDRRYATPATRFPGTLSQAMREEAARRLGHAGFDVILSLPERSHADG